MKSLAVESDSKHMPAPITSENITWHEPIVLQFGFTGLKEIDAISVVRREIQEQFSPKLKYYEQCVYVVRLRGDVAVAYGDSFSPVIYIGEGNAKSRLYGHAGWIARLLLSVPNIRIAIHVAELKRRNNTELCEFVEADLIRWFCEKYNRLPWFNRQRERSKESRYEYDLDAEKGLRDAIAVGSGSSFLWAIRPTHNNEEAWGAYEKNPGY